MYRTHAERAGSPLPLRRRFLLFARRGLAFIFGELACLRLAFMAGLLIPAVHTLRPAWLCVYGSIQGAIKQCGMQPGTCVWGTVVGPKRRTSAGNSPTVTSLQSPTKCYRFPEIESCIKA